MIIKEISGELRMEVPVRILCLIHTTLRDNAERLEDKGVNANFELIEYLRSNYGVKGIFE